MYVCVLLHLAVEQIDQETENRNIGGRYSSSTTLKPPPVHSAEIVPHTPDKKGDRGPVAASAMPDNERLIQAGLAPWRQEALLAFWP